MDVAFLGSGDLDYQLGGSVSGGLWRGADEVRIGKGRGRRMNGGNKREKEK